MSVERIDLNADVGEGCGGDQALLAIVTSANIACGAHAGDETTMRATIRAAVKQGVAIGAHPSFPDRANFGRAMMERTAEEIERDVAGQIETLARIAGDEGTSLAHVKPHGALYNLAARDRVVADAISRAVVSRDPSLALVGLAGGEQRAGAIAHGLRPVEEVFADRRYLPDGSLVPRTRPGALIDDEREAVAQALGFLDRGFGETICVHGDTRQAVRFAAALRAALEKRGVRIERPRS